MELVVLSRTDLAIKDYGYFGSDYEIVLDAVVYQKSKFIINKANLNAQVGDIVFTKGLPFSYIGIIEAITKEENDLIQYYLQLLHQKDFLLLLLLHSKYIQSLLLDKLY